MGLWDSFCDNVLCPIGSVIADGVETVGRGVDTAVNTVVIDGVCGGLDKAIDLVKENPVETALVVGTTVATGGLAVAAAGPIAAAIGSTGVLGAASTGTAIASLHGAAATSASLAALGGGAVAAGGGGTAVGTMIVGAGGAAVGATASTAAVASNRA